MNSAKKTARVAGLLYLLKVLRYCFLLAVAGCLLLAQPLMAAEGINGNLVSVNWLKTNLKNADVLILDSSPAQSYTAQHIPGAVSVDLFTYGAQEMPVADMEQLCQSWGISPGKKIVLYDQGGTMGATRQFFSLYILRLPRQGPFHPGRRAFQVAEGRIAGNEGYYTCPEERLFQNQEAQRRCESQAAGIPYRIRGPGQQCVAGSTWGQLAFWRSPGLYQGRPYP